MITEGAVGLYTNEGAPVNGTNEVQTVTVTADDSAGGTYRLEFEGFFTAELADDASSADVQTALRALPSIGSTGCSVTGSAGGPYSVTFTNERGKQEVGLITVKEETNVSVTVVEATPGVTATARGAGKGSILTDTTNGKLYVNSGTGIAPTWTVVGTQT